MGGGKWDDEESKLVREPLRARNEETRYSKLKATSSLRTRTYLSISGQLDAEILIDQSPHRHSIKTMKREHSMA